MAKPLEHARQWHKEGLLSDEALQTLEERHAHEGLGTLSVALLGGAGIVLAAATIAFPILLSLSRQSTGVFAGIAAAVAAGGAIAAWQNMDRREYGEALGLTSLALAVVAGFALLDLVPILAICLGTVALGVVWLPQQTVLVPGGGVLAASALFGGGFSQLMGDQAAISALFGIAAAATLALLMSPKLVQSDPGWRHETANFFAVGVTCVAGLTFGFEVLQWTFLAAMELWVGLIAGGILALAFWLRDRSALLAAVTVLAIDAVVFGFDVGELWLGIPMLLLVAGGLVALALWAQRDGAPPTQLL